MDAAGNLFGVCLSGGSGNGWVFELTNCSQSCVVRDLRDGSSPYGSPTLDANGNVYGTTEYGGNIIFTVMATAAAWYGRLRVWVLRVKTELMRGLSSH